MKDFVQGSFLLREKKRVPSARSIIIRGSHSREFAFPQLVEEIYMERNEWITKEPFLNSLKKSCIHS